jgi:hypothetical protein
MQFHPDESEGQRVNRERKRGREERKKKSENESGKTLETRETRGKVRGKTSERRNTTKKVKKRQTYLSVALM